MKKAELRDKRPGSPGLMVNPPSQQAKRENIQSQTDVFLTEGGSIEQIASGVMKAETKGPTPIRINHEQVADGFKPKQDA